MAYLSSSQEFVPVNTLLVLPSSLQLPQKKYGEENIRSSYSVILQDSMDLEYLWTAGFASRYGLSRSEDLKSASNPGSFSTLKHCSYDVFFSYEAKSDFALSLQNLLDRGVSTSVSNTSLSKSWQFFPNLLFNLQELSTVKQIQEERNTVVHGLQQAKDIDQLNDLTIASSSEDVQPLEQLYRFQESIKIYHFLEKNVFLAPLLKEAYTHIRKYFPYAQLFLKVVTDPESVDDEQLVVFTQ